MGNDEQSTIEQPAEHDERETIPKPEVTDEHREQAKEMAKAYEDDRPTVALPGTSNTVTGQAVSEWVEEDGSPKFGDVKDGGGVKREDVMGVRKDDMSHESDDKD